MKKLERGLRESSKSLCWHSDVRVVMMSWQEADTNMWEEGASSWQLTDSLLSEQTSAGHLPQPRSHGWKLNSTHWCLGHLSKWRETEASAAVRQEQMAFTFWEHGGRISSTHKENYTGEMMFEATWKPWRIRRILPGSMLSYEEGRVLKALATLWAKRTADYSLHRTVSSMA